VDFDAHLPAHCDDVRVRRLRYGDAEAFALGTRDPAVREHGHLPLTEYTPHIVREQIDGVIAQGLADGTLAALAIADRASDHFAGSVVLFDIHDDRAEVGFWLTPQARGRGFAVKSLHAVAGLGAAAGLSVLQARTSPENVASQRVLEASGFTSKGAARPQRTPSGAVVPLLAFVRPL